MREQIRQKVIEYHRATWGDRRFDPTRDLVHYAGRVFDEAELVNLMEACLDFWLTEGRFCRDFQSKIADFLGAEHVLLTNSGSSANLLAIAALTSSRLGKRALRPGDEVVTVAAGFPTTVTAILKNALVPVYIDVSLPTYNPAPELVAEAIGPKTRAIFLAHTLGNPFSAEAIRDLAREKNLWLVEDNCDALGSLHRGRPTGTFGQVSTLSFYPAHHITTGEGGAVVTGDPQLARIIRSLRDWGRDCHCSGGESDACGTRFKGQFGTLPFGYDHKYVYSELGYNLKMTDLQAAIGSAQMDKLERFGAARRRNFQRWQNVFSPLAEFFILPEATPESDPSWFGYPVSVRATAPFSRNDFTRGLESRRIETRNLFAGNILRHPAFLGSPRRVAGDLSATDFVMNNTFFLGTFPGLTEDMFAYAAGAIDDFRRGL